MLTGDDEQIVVRALPPTSARGHRVLRLYMADVISRYYGRPATDDELETEMRESPSNDLAAPGGMFLVAQEGGNDVGCVGLRFVSDRIGEIKRLFVVPAARGRGIGSRLMNELEMLAEDNGLLTLRLDTRADLVEARRLYARLGYREVDAFNHGPYAEHWFRKDLRV